MAEIIFSNTTGYDYTLQGAYESYLQNKIDNENRLADMIEEALVLTETSTTYTMKKQKLRTLYEAKLGDNVKSKWNRFLNFIKSLFGKFMESMTNILLNEKDYLEKYKDIITEKRGKSELHYTYSGDYEKGIQRIIDVTVPMFDYDKYKDELAKDGDGALLKKIVPNVDYDEDDGVATTMKNYFIAADAGDQDEVHFDTIEFINLYNFCINFKKTKDVVEKDVRFLEQSTNNINKAIQEAIKARDDAAKAAGGNNNNNETGGEDNNNNNNNVNQGVNNNVNQGENNNKSLDINDAIKQLKYNVNTGKRYSEADARLFIAVPEYKNVDKNTFIAKAKAENLIDESAYLIEEENKPSKMKIEKDPSTKVSTQAGSFISKDDKADTENSAARKANLDATTKSDSTEIYKAIDKWIRVCRDIITAKWTATESIASDYMKIIRAHVRSYVGKADDPADKVAKKQGRTWKYEGNGKDNTGNKDIRDAEAKARAAKEEKEKQEAEQGSENKQ